jgi:anti-sigma B factor antagonist
MKFSSAINHDYLLLTLEGKLIGEDSGSSMLEVANDAINNGTLKCVVDIEKVKYIDSTGIGVLITLLTKFRNQGGEIVIINPSEHVQKLLIITKLTAIFKIADSIEEAIDSLQQS